MSDGASLIKVMLAPALNRLVERHELQPSSIILLRDYRAIRDELDIGGAVLSAIRLC